MILRFILSIIVCGFMFFPCLEVAGSSIEGFSPNGRNRLVIETGAQVSYSIFRDGSQIMNKSFLSLRVGSQLWGVNDECVKVRRSYVSEIVNFPVPRKYRQTINNYNLLELSYRTYKIEFRIYDEGIAYRFVSLFNSPLPVEDEHVTFGFIQNHKTYSLLTNQLQNWFEQDYTIRPILQLPRDSFSIAPVMVEVDKYKVLLAEANLYNYAGMYLRPDGLSFVGTFAKYPDVENIIEDGNKRYVSTREDYIVPICGKRNFPWRVIGIFDDAASILRSELIYLLSEEKEEKSDVSWIRPGKVLWDWWNDRNIYGVNFKVGINTNTYLYLIDYAARHKIEYILIDEGWSDKNDLLKTNPSVDIPYICAYAKQKKVGILLWAKWLNLEQKMDEVFSVFEKWGVSGVKIDFMDRNDAKMVAFYETVAINAMKHKLLVDFHGSYPNEGLRRKYPNLMTREGVIGLEYNKWSKRATVTHDVIIPYLRMWVGPMDYTPGAMLNAHLETFYENQHEPMSQGTRSHQLAMYVVYESPLQMMADSPAKYDENPASLNFIKEIPTVWDETIPLEGEVGEYIAIARRHNDIWYIGVLNGSTPRELELDLSFMGKGKKCVSFHEDGINADSQAKDVRVGYCTLQENDKLLISMTRGGGYLGIVQVK